MLFSRFLLVQRTLALRSGEAQFVSHSASSSGAPKTLKQKALVEVKKMLKIQLVLLPVLTIILLLMYPVPSEAEEKKMRLEYEEHAGWKT